MNQRNYFKLEIINKKLLQQLEHIERRGVCKQRLEKLRREI